MHTTSGIISVEDAKKGIQLTTTEVRYLYYEKLTPGFNLNSRRTEVGRTMIVLFFSYYISQAGIYLNWNVMLTVSDFSKLVSSSTVLETYSR